MKGTCCNSFLRHDRLRPFEMLLTRHGNLWCIEELLWYSKGQRVLVCMLSLSLDEIEIRTLQSNVNCVNCFRTCYGVFFWLSTAFSWLFFCSSMRWCNCQCNPEYCSLLQFVTENDKQNIVRFVDGWILFFNSQRNCFADSRWELLVGLTYCNHNWKS